jgi:hypothetical protein
LTSPRAECGTAFNCAIRNDGTGDLHSFAQRLAEADQSLVPVARYVAPDAKFMTSTPVASRSARTMPPSWHSADPLIQSLLDSNRSTSCCHRKEDCFTARGSSAENPAGRRLVEVPDDLRRVGSDFFDLLDNRKRRHQREAKANQVVTAAIIPLPVIPLPMFDEELRTCHSVFHFLAQTGRFRRIRG